ncbi:hypothetical protein AUC68_14695 [Methyloceanibacter methanicus]|uniref:BioF2-like acetyltransferase domain-containing protein n=1 Tax=Methyloceanibacter methanicus TaxID=1774968 RepID=A0A1E3W3X5_9HYPH|nr:GNAT family N-acetyltransferase [Methyloceanibacter methanicus]ODS00509.1 hypothetical protein AUC68_14695 [Methyloceanibacter methanicus]
MVDFTWCNEFDFRSEPYERLFGRSAASGFQHPIWLARVYGQLVPAKGVHPAILTGYRKSDGRLVYVVPMVKRSFASVSYGEYADLGVMDYCSPVVDDWMAKALRTDRALREDLGAAWRQFTIARLQKLHAENVRQILGLQSACCTTMAVHAHSALIKAPFSTWRETALTDSFRRFLDRKRRLLGKKAEIEFSVATNEETIETAFRALRAFHRQRWTNSLLQQEIYYDFYRDVALEGSRVGAARTYLLTADGQPAGVLFGLASRGRFYLLFMGVNYDVFRNYSVGLLMIESAIEDAIARHERVFDLTIGDEPYKDSFGTVSTPMYAAWFGPPAAARVASVAQGARAKIRSARTRLVTP